MPMENRDASSDSFLSKKRFLIIAEGEENELHRIDELIEQLYSGSFCREMDHPYYDRYRQMEANRDRRLRVAKKRLDFALQRVEEELAAESLRLRLSFLDGMRLLWNRTGDDHFLRMEKVSCLLSSASRSVEMFKLSMDSTEDSAALQIQKDLEIISRAT